MEAQRQRRCRFVLRTVMAPRFATPEGQVFGSSLCMYFNPTHSYEYASIWTIFGFGQPNGKSNAKSRCRSFALT